MLGFPSQCPKANPENTKLAVSHGLVINCDSIDNVSAATAYVV
jgi:hypothetical protein